MKKKILIIAFGYMLSLTGKAQMVDPASVVIIGQNSTLITLQSEQVFQAIEALGVTKEVLQNAKQVLQYTKQGVQFAAGTYKMMDDIAEGRVNFNLMNYLKINNIQDLVEQILCVRFEDFVPNNQEYYNIYLNFRGSILNCNNSAYYNMTFPGLLNKLIKGDIKLNSLTNVPPAIPTYSSGNNTVQPGRNKFNIVTTNSAITEMDAMINNAQNYAAFSNVMNTRLKLEIGYKYLQLADKLYKDADELYQAVTNQITPIKMEWSERQKLIMSCVDYEMKSFDYKMKGMQLIQEASASPDAKAGVKAQSTLAKINLINQQVLLGR